MKKIAIASIYFLIILCIISCSEDSIPNNSKVETEFSNKLRLKTDQFEYHLNIDSWNNYYCTITGTIKNLTQDTFYSKIGDSFNSDFEQDNFSIAYQTDGFFEFKNLNEKWKNVEQFWSIEGNKIIPILPNKEYTYIASAIIDTNKLGDHRIRLNYYKEYLTNNIDTLRDTSNTFVIKK
ncbi:MAG: hypothetical protein WAR79_19155 [Melioribacteraceae bacterium]